MNTAEHIVQAQLDAYNARDLQAFVACYDEQIEVFRPPAAEPVIAGIAALAQHYADKRCQLTGFACGAGQSHGDRTKGDRSRARAWFGRAHH